MTCVLRISTEEYLDNYRNLEAEIILIEPSQLYLPSLTDNLSLFTFIDLLGEIFMRIHIYLLYYEVNIYSVHCFSLFSGNIGARIKNVHFRGFGKMSLLLIRVVMAQTTENRWEAFQNEGLMFDVQR